MLFDDDTNATVVDTTAFQADSALEDSRCVRVMRLDISGCG